MIAQVGFGNGRKMKREREKKRHGFGYGRTMKRDRGAIVCGFWEWKREREAGVREFWEREKR